MAGGGAEKGRGKEEKTEEDKKGAGAGRDDDDKGEEKARKGIDRSTEKTERWEMACGGGGLERSLEALKHFALPAQQMPHSVWHSDLWACSIYTLTVSLQGQHYMSTHLVSGFCSSPEVAKMMKSERHLQTLNGNKVYTYIINIQRTKNVYSQSTLTCLETFCSFHTWIWALNAFIPDRSSNWMEGICEHPAGLSVDDF